MMRAICVLPHAVDLYHSGGTAKLEYSKLYDYWYICLPSSLDRELLHITLERKQGEGDFSQHIKLTITLQYPKMSPGDFIFRKTLL